MRIYMQTQYATDQPLRFYQLHLQPDLLGGWTLIRQSGVEGMRGQMVREHFEHREEAELRMIRHRDRQLARGYRIVFREGASLESE